MTTAENVLGFGLRIFLRSEVARVTKRVVDNGVRDACEILKRKGWASQEIVEALTLPYPTLAQKYSDDNLLPFEREVIYKSVSGYDLRKRVSVRYLALKTAMDASFWGDSSRLVGFRFRVISVASGQQVETMTASAEVLGLTLSAVVERESGGEGSKVALEYAKSLPRADKLG